MFPFLPDSQASFYQSSSLGCGRPACPFTCPSVSLSVRPLFILMKGNADASVRVRCIGCGNVTLLWIYVIAGSECTYNDPKGAHYLGRMTRTDKDYTCVQWSRQTTYRDNRFSNESRADASNFCRNPYPPSDKPWCYYRVYRTYKRNGFCTISPCRTYDNIEHVYCAILNFKC